MPDNKSRAEELLSKIPKEGLLRVATRSQVDLPKDKRAALIRKGNEYYNQGKIELAKKIFLTTGYSDGLIRLGDLYYEQDQLLEAFRMYWLAPDRKKVESLVEQTARVIQKWLNE